jgi:hypothetical protein
MEKLPGPTPRRKPMRIKPAFQILTSRLAARIRSPGDVGLVLSSYRGSERFRRCESAQQASNTENKATRLPHEPETELETTDNPLRPVRYTVLHPTQNA